MYVSVFSEKTWEFFWHSRVKSQLSFLPLKGDTHKTEMQEEHLLMDYFKHYAEVYKLLGILNMEQPNT